jgi:hypothetical protein
MLDCFWLAEKTPRTLISEALRHLVHSCSTIIYARHLAESVDEWEASFVTFPSPTTDGSQDEEMRRLEAIDGVDAMLDLLF